MFRGTCSQMIFKTGVLKNLANFTGKGQCKFWGNFLIMYKETPTLVFSCETAKFLRTFTLNIICKWLLLNVLSLLIEKTGGKSEEKDAIIVTHRILFSRQKSVVLDLCPGKWNKSSKNASFMILERSNT